MKSSVHAGIHETQPLSIEKNEVVSGGVSRLLRLVGPYAVIFRIPEVVVDSIKRMSFARAWSHISKEVSEVFPSRINCNASPSVVFVHSVVRARTTSNHALPGRVFWGPCPSFPMAVLFRRFVFPATTRLFVAAPKLRNRCCCNFSALAHARPINSIVYRFISVKSCKKSKILTSNVNGSRSQNGIFPTSARFGMPVFNLYPFNAHNISTHTDAFPTRLTVRVIPPSTKYSQVVEFQSGQFKSFHTHSIYNSSMFMSTLVNKEKQLCQS